MSRELVVEKELEIRFSEVDMMGVVWHGNYPLYLEDAREAFGAEFGLSYALYIRENVFVPIVKMDVDYKRLARHLFGMYSGWICQPVMGVDNVEIYCAGDNAGNDGIVVDFFKKIVGIAT